MENSNILELPHSKSVDIDNLTDWKKAKFYAKKK